MLATLSSVADLGIVPRGLRRHGVVITAQVIRATSGERFKFLTCGVKEGGAAVEGPLKYFSVKAFNEYRNVFDACRGGDVVEFRNLYVREKNVGKRGSKDWKNGPNDLDVEFEASALTTIMVVVTPHAGIVTDFDLIVVNANDITVVGQIYAEPIPEGEYFVAVIQDARGRFMEVKMNEDNGAMVFGQEWSFQGNVAFEQGMKILTVVAMMNLNVQAGNAVNGADGNAAVDGNGGNPAPNGAVGAAAGNGENGVGAGNGGIGAAAGNGGIGAVAGNGVIGAAAGNGGIGAVAAAGNGGIGAAAGNGGIGAVAGNGVIGAAAGNGGIGAVAGNGVIGAAAGNGGIGAVAGNGGIGVGAGNGGIGAAVENGGIGAAVGNGGIGAAVGNGLNDVVVANDVAAGNAEMFFDSNDSDSE